MDIWIFTPDLTISSSSSSPSVPLRVAKFLWRVQPDSTSGDGDTIMRNDEGRLDRKALSQGHLDLPQEEFLVLRNCLERSAEILPLAAREFMGWKVGVLERFGRDDR
jgi:hypothetical protein